MHVGFTREKICIGVKQDQQFRTTLDRYANKRYKRVYYSINGSFSVNCYTVMLKHLY